MTQIEVEIDYDVFLPKYRPYVDSPADIFVLWGGRDSGKSHFIAQQLVKDCIQNDYFKCILSRKVQDTIKESQWETIKEIVRDWGLDSLFNFTSHPLEIRCVNGNKFIARGADKGGKVKGVKDPTHAWFEELNQMSSDEYSVVSSTLRSNVTKVKEYWSFNPECAGSYDDFWLYDVVGSDYSDHQEVKTMRVGSVDIDVVYQIIHSTYNDNEFCPPERKAKYLNTTDGDSYLYDVWINGWWGNREVLRPFAHSYDDKLHVAETKHNPTAMTMVLVDFNIDPYCANVFNAWKDEKGLHCYQVDEIEFNSGTIQEMSERIKSSIGEGVYSMYLGGDAMGNNRTIGNRDNKSLFAQLVTALGINPRQLKIVANPGHGTSRTDVNYFLKNYPDFKIGKHCAGTRRDMRSVEVDAYGSILKKNRKDENQRADFMDNVRYCINTFFKQAILKHQKTGEW